MTALGTIVEQILRRRIGFSTILDERKFQHHYNRSFRKTATRIGTDRTNSKEQLKLILEYVRAIGGNTSAGLSILARGASEADMKKTKVKAAQFLGDGLGSLIGFIEAFASTIEKERSINYDRSAIDDGDVNTVVEMMRRMNDNIRRELGSIEHIAFIREKLMEIINGKFSRVSYTTPAGRFLVGLVKVFSL